MGFLKINIFHFHIFLSIVICSKCQEYACNYTVFNESAFETGAIGQAFVNSWDSNLNVIDPDIETNELGTDITTEVSTGEYAYVTLFIKLESKQTNSDRVWLYLGYNATVVSSVTLTFDLFLLDAFWGGGIPAAAQRSGRKKVTYTVNNLAKDAIANLSFVAEIGKDARDNAVQGISQHVLKALVEFEANGKDFVVVPEVCFDSFTTVEEVVNYEHGYTALAFFILFFIGIALAVFVVWLFLYCRRRKKEASVSPTKDKKMKAKGKKIVVDAKEALKRGTNPIKDFSLIAWDDSLVSILGMKDKLHMYREIDNLDILSTIEIDTDLEKEQREAAIQASILLVDGLKYNRDVNSATVDKAKSSLMSRLNELDKKSDAEYKKGLEVIYVDIEAKNKEKLSDLIKNHDEQKADLAMLSKDIPKEEQDKMTELLDAQQQAEENELTYRLALEQNEEAEKLRKEFAIRKRMGVKDIQQQFLNDVIVDGKLVHEQAEWLIKQHKEQQEEIHKKYDEEISRQRMNLEEKLSRRRAMAKASETAEDNSAEKLNMIAGFQIFLVSKMKKNRNLSEEQLDQFLNQAKADLQEVKSKMEMEKEKEICDLFSRQSQIKRKTLALKIEQHQKELKNFMQQSKEQQTEGPVDPVSYVNGLIGLRSRQRKELMVVENDLDEQHAQELDDLRNRKSDQATDEMKNLEMSLVAKLREDGLEEREADKLISKHKEQLADLEARQTKSRQIQELKLQDELARRKREWEDQRDSERQEQRELRDHEAEVVDKLLSSQVSMSVDERDRILKEHEKNMVKLENSLTLNKLRQQRRLEEKIAQKRAKQMSELEEKQKGEIVKQRKVAENNGEEDDEESHRRELELMKKHAAQRMAVLQGEHVNFDQELNEIKEEMNKERAIALKDQEERLGAMVAALQLDKARELSKIEEQQKAINNLKAGLMDDLNSRGVLSTPECERILSIHKEEQDKLNIRLDFQRNKQEKLLKKKLEERIHLRENSMIQKQESEMKEIMDKTSNKTGARIRRTILMNKHLMEMEKFRNNLDREISQTLEETKREFEIQKQTISQEQELQFISGLVKVGSLSRNELLDVLHMLFPGKTEESINDMLSKIYGSDNASDNNGSNTTTLPQRIYLEQFSNPTPVNRRGSVMSAAPTNTKSRKLSKTGSRLSIANIDEVVGSDFKNRRVSSSQASNRRTSKQADGLGLRNELVSQINNRRSSKPAVSFSRDDYSDDDEYGSERPPLARGRLEPLQPAKAKKKKKGFLKNRSGRDDDDDYYS